MTEDSSKKSFLDKIIAEVQGFAKRILVHICAVLCAIVVGKFFTSMFAVYIGFICLFARGMALKPSWLIPTVIGTLQVFICLFLGIPLDQAIFWGGVQTWIQRVFIKQYAMGSEWFLLIFLTPLVFKLMTYSNNILLMLASFGIVFLLGGFFIYLYRRAERQKKLVKEAQEKIILQVATEEKDKQKRYDEYRQSINKLRNKHFAMDKQAIQDDLGLLIKSADGILICMLENSRSTKMGDEYLKKYLPQTHLVLDNYFNFASKNAKEANEDLEDILQKSEKSLKDLSQHFSLTYKELLRNDVDDHKVDLNLLDKTLRI